MKVALVLDKTEEGQGHIATALDGQKVQIKAVHHLREVDFSDIEKDHGKAHFSRDEAEEIMRVVPGYEVVLSPYSGLFLVIREG